jgi:hypothetical protein
VARSQVPEADLRLVQQFCAYYWPAKFHEEVRGEYHLRGVQLTLCETRVPWDGKGEWIHSPIAQLRYRTETTDWTLHWPDGDSRWHRYDEGNVSSGSVAQLLAEVEEDPTGIFKG